MIRIFLMLFLDVISSDFKRGSRLIENENRSNPNEVEALLVKTFS